MEDIDEEEVKKLEVLFQYLTQLADDGITPLIEKQVILLLDNCVKFFSHLCFTDCFPEIKRLTINRNVIGRNKRISDIKYLKYPPSDLVKKYGRCNMPNQSILYSAFDMLTVLNELKPQKGDLITISTWRVKNRQQLKCCPIFRNQPAEIDVVNPRTLDFDNIFQERLAEYPTNIQNLILQLVQFISDSFSKKIDTRNHLDYIFSAYFSNKIFNEFENGTIEAIYYPSVQQSLSFENLAIKPESFDSKYELVSVKESVVITTPENGRGGYFMEGLSDCNSFDYLSDKVLWNPKDIRQPESAMINLKKLYNIEID